MNEPELIVIGSSSGAWMMFALLAAVGVGIGAVVFAVLWSKRARRPQFREMGTLPLLPSAAIGLTIAAAVAGAGWYGAFERFRAVRLTDQTLQLHYECPARVVELTRAQVTRVEEDFSGKSWSLLITTTDGAYSSGPAAVPHLQFVHTLIDAWRQR